MDRGQGDAVVNIAQNELNSLTLVDGLQRPDQGGQSGRKINVFANLFAIQIKKDLHITHFDVNIVPIREPSDQSNSRPLPANDRPLPSEIQMSVFKHALSCIEQLTSEQRRSLAFDGRRNSVASRELPFNEKQMEVELEPLQGTTNRRRRLYNVKVQRTGQFSADVMYQFMKGDSQTVRSSGTAYLESLGRVVQSLNTIFRVDAIEQYRVHRAGGRRFFDPNRTTPISNGAEIWHGFFQSVLPLRGGLFVNLDVAFSPFLIGGPFLEVADRILEQGGRSGGGAHRDRGGRGRGGDRLYDHHVRQQLRKVLRNANVSFTHRQTNRPGKYKDLTGDSARTIMFNRNGKEVTVANYIHEVYGIRLKHPDWPCVVLGSEKKLVPVELCIIVGGTPIPPQKMSARQVQDMIRVSAQRPPDRLHETINWRRIRNYEQNEKLQAWNVEVSRNPVEIQARVLNPPRLHYRDPMREVPQFGKWNLRTERFFTSGVNLITPVFINLSNRDEGQCMHFIRPLSQKCKQLGMNLDPNIDRVISCWPSRGEEVGVALRKAGSKAYNDGGQRMRPQIFFCFLDPQSRHYEDIKRVACTEFPLSVPSQCLNVEKAFNNRGQDQYLTNLCMKINIKLGGCNQVLQNPEDVPKIARGTMMIGLDVRHPPPGIERESVVAAVATLNGQGTKIGNQVLTQSNPRLGHQQEAILQGHQLFSNLLNLWREDNKGQLPESIIVFRDGVSQGEYMQVKGYEVAQLKQACSDLTGKGQKEPKIVYVIGTKRHRIRFFAKDPRDADRSGNLPAGMVVDTTVTHPYIFEFYLQAHSGIVGTCRPAKYIVLHDELRFTSEEMQRLINSLCYSYQRATRSVSQVPMAKYAHFLAEKASFILYPNNGLETSSSGVESARPVDDLNAKLNRRPDKQGAVTLSKVPWFL